MKNLTIKVSGSQSKTRHTWSINPVTRVHENDPKRNTKKERQKSKMLLKKAHEDAPFEFVNLPHRNGVWSTHPFAPLDKRTHSAHSSNASSLFSDSWSNPQPFEAQIT